MSIPLQAVQSPLQTQERLRAQVRNRRSNDRAIIENPLCEYKWLWWSDIAETDSACSTSHGPGARGGCHARGTQLFAPCRSPEAAAKCESGQGYPHVR